MFENKIFHCDIESNEEPYIEGHTNKKQWLYSLFSHNHSQDIDISK